MNQQTYERTALIITEFDTEDIITTSTLDDLPGGNPDEGSVL